MPVGKTESPSVVLGSVELGTVGLVSDIPGERDNTRNANQILTNAYTG